MNSIPILWGLGTAIAGLPLTLFNNANLWCWIAPLPLDCEETGTCVRGDNADIYRWVFFYGPLWCMILVVTFNVTIIFRYVRKVEKASEAYKFTASIVGQPSSIHASRGASLSTSGDGDVSSRGMRGSMGMEKRSRQVANQCFWYAGAFYLNWLALTVSVFMYNKQRTKSYGKGRFSHSTLNNDVDHPPDTDS